MPPKLDVKL
ncbi:hypothetical protein VTJ04DRAFT_3832 [Mycothermus thermophilus]